MLKEGDHSAVVDVTSFLPELVYLSSRSSWIFFYVSGLKPPLDEHKVANLELTLIDLCDKPHKIEGKNISLVRGKLECY